MEEVRISEWPDPPGSHAWLPAYGFQHEIVDKDDYFSSNGDAGSREALYLETIVEETSDDLRSERSALSDRSDRSARVPAGAGAGAGAGWLSDSDADSVIPADHAPGSECDSESERENACPAKRRRRGASPGGGSAGELSRSSSLARFESLERSCACAAPGSPSLSPDSLESPPASPPPARAPSARTHLSAENLSEDSGYSERARRPLPPPPPARAPAQLARAPAAGSAPCLAAPEPPPRAAPRSARALSLPAELDVYAEPRRHVAHRARFRQTFEVSDSFTVSVADLTALDYRGGPRRPRLPSPPPPPPPRTRRHSPPAHPPPPPPAALVIAPSASPAREPSAGSDSTTESEHAFAREMEATARRLDENARRALTESGAYDRELSVLTAHRLQNSWGAWDDVLDELRRRIEPTSPSHSSPRTASPEPIRDQPAFASTPLRAGSARVRSTPELRARATPSRETPEELRASLQLVGPPAPAPPVRSVSAGSKGVTFSPVVAEVSWREASASTTASESATTTASDDASDAEVAVVAAGGGHAHAPAATDCAADMTDAAVRAPRSRIAGFLSRFAKFRFSGRKEKKSRGAGATARPPASQGAGAADSTRTPRAAAAPPQYVRIPLKEEGVSAAAGRVALRPPRPPPAPAAPASAAPAGVLETDVDTQRTVLHARSLLALAPPEARAARPHKSMEFLLDKDSAQIVQPPENELQKHSARELSEHELRVRRSLQKLHVPDWYKNAPAPRESFILRKRLSDAGACAAAGRWGALDGRTTSLGSLGAAPAPHAPHLSPHAPHLSPHATSFGRWSTSRLNSNQTSPCSSTRSSVRGAGASPLCSPSARSSFSARQPYLGWRSQERLHCTPRTPHERLASSLLQQTAESRAAEEIQSSIKEVTSAIVHYVSALEPAERGRSPSPRPPGGARLCWLESSFVGTKPLESPQTPVGVSEALPPPHPRPPSSLRLERRAAPAAPAGPAQPPSAPVTGLPAPALADCEEWLQGAAPATPGSATLEDVLDSLLGLPAPAQRAPSPHHSPRKPLSPYYLGGKSPRYEPLASSAASSASPASRRASAAPSPAASPPASIAPGVRAVTAGVISKDIVDHPVATQESRRPRTDDKHARRRSEPCEQAHGGTRTPRRTSLEAAAAEPLSPPGSLASLNTENSADEVIIRCKYSRCSSRTHLADAKRHYKTCHNCATMYCSRECRRAHWEKHRKVCLHSRASVLCRQIISAAKEDSDSLYQISTVAYKGYLALGKGVVKVFFTSPEAAEKFTTNGFQHLTQPEYVKWTSLQPNEMGVELYAEVVKLCKAYNPETRVILYAAVCIISEVPTKGAVKWERQLVSRCAKLRLSKAVSAVIQEQSRRRQRRGSRGDERETLVLASGASSTTDRTAQFREQCFQNIILELESRGVMVKKHFPEVYSRLAAYADGSSSRFIPMTIYPKDVNSGKYFICVIMPEHDAESITPPAEGRVTRVDVGTQRARRELATPL